jgi:C1A family cysteine protease
LKTLAIIALVGLAATAFVALNNGYGSSAELEFRNFLDTHRVGYGTTEEFNYRLSVFNDNLSTIAKLNAANPDATFEVNQFADRTEQEMSQLMGFIMPAGRKITGEHVAPVDAQDQDWSQMWSTVKDQGQCGSCWAFSATAAFEARYALAQGAQTVTTLFSEQELVDCDTASAGCNGGWMDLAFTYLEANGFCTEAQYPYTARDGTCNAAVCSSGPNDKAFVDIPAKNEDSLLTNLASGPISVAVDASTWSFYSGGIMSSCGTGLNHGVTLVGYSSGDGSATIRNSWGSAWGEHGHIRIKTGQDTCGYANVASYPTF